MDIGQITFSNPSDTLTASPVTDTTHMYGYGLEESKGAKDGSHRLFIYILLTVSLIANIALFAIVARFDRELEGLSDYTLRTDAAITGVMLHINDRLMYQESF
ncbi:MAG: hypothetical protein ACXQTI_01900 [Candidatus Nezhaarchaeales archaeon]